MSRYTAHAKRKVVFQNGLGLGLGFEKQTFCVAGAERCERLQVILLLSTTLTSQPKTYYALPL